MHPLSYGCTQEATKHERSIRQSRVQLWLLECLAADSTAQLSVDHFFYNIAEYIIVFKLRILLMIKYKILARAEKKLHTTAFILTNDQGPFAFKSSIKTFFTFFTKENNI
jgi:hypothetical protein